MLTVGSVFAGIGGLELGLESTGHFRTRWQVETDEYAQRILAQHWPSVDRFGDIRKIRRGHLAPVDVICGGFPCQDISYAGGGAGLAGARSGLWYEMLRVVRMVRPKYVIVENVAALLTRGLDTVLGGLSQAGYDAEWTTLRASDVESPHKRERVFVLAYPRRKQPERKRISRSMADAGSHASGEAQERERGRDATCDSREDHVGVAHRRGDADMQRWAEYEHGRTELADARSRGRVALKHDAHAREPDSPRSGRPLLGEATVGVTQRAGDSNESRPQGRPRGGARADELPPWPPGPADSDAWRRVIEIEPNLEPAICRMAARFSGWLDGSRGKPISAEAHALIEQHATSAGIGTGEVVRSVWRIVGAKDFQWPAGGPRGLPAKKVLLTFLRQLAPIEQEEGDAPLESEAIPERRVRSVRLSKTPARASRRREPRERPTGKHSDALHALSLVLASHADAARQTYLREDAESLRAYAGRVDRIRALGNAVVPQVAAIIGWRIVQIEKAWGVMK